MDLDILALEIMTVTILQESPHRAALDTSEQIGELHQIMKYNGAEVKLKIYKTVP